MNYAGTGLFAMGALTAGGVPVPATFDPTNGWGVTFATGTYFMPLGSELGGLITETQDQSVSAKWTAAFAASLSFEVTNFSRSLSAGGQGGVDVSDFDNTPSWQAFNPAASASVAYTSSSGSGNTWTNLVLAAGGTTAGGAYANIPGMTARRMRIRIVVTATGFLRVLPWAKIGA